MSELDLLTDRYWDVTKRRAILEAKLIELKNDQKAIEAAIAAESGKLQYQFDLTEEKLTDH